MGKILVINPNTSEEMTNEIRKTAEKIVSPQHNVVVVHSPIGPESIESFYEDHLATIGLIRAAKAHPDADAVVVACFDDPGLYALKEILDVPVVGIGEASFSVALLIGYKFSILVALDKAVALMDHMVLRYGLKDRLASVRALNIPVLDLERSPEKTLKALIETGRKAVEEDYAEVLILGCAGMTDFDVKIEKELKVPVIDPVKAGVKMAEALLDGGFKTSRRALYMSPPPKKIIGEDVFFKKS